MAALTVDEGSSGEQLWITGGDDWDYGYTQSGIDIYDGTTITASSIELPTTLFNHALAQVNADKIIVLGGCTKNGVCNANQDTFMLSRSSGSKDISRGLMITLNQFEK